MNAAFLLAGLLAFTQGVNAQGLGEISLQSALNEPLHATIDLLDVSGLNVNQINIAIASDADYRQAGLERSALLGQIKFSVELFPLGRGQVTLTSESRIDEPFLSLLINASWPSGRVVREYTVLLDLPTLSSNAAAQQAITAAQTSSTAPSRQVVTDLSSAANNASAASTFTVESGDTLWEIAEKTRPSANISVQQMMIAIQRANEDAFVNNNINRLLNGRVLRIPNQQEVSIIEFNAAVAQINAQNEDLGLMRLGETGSSDRPAAVRDELSVLSGDDTQASGAGSSDLEATIAALENEMMLSEEDLDKSRLENDELTAQLGDLEEQIDILQNIIAIEDERIAQLQSELQEQAEATDQALAEAARAAQLLAASEPPVKAQGMMDRLMALLQNNLILIGGALLVVVMVLALLVSKARRNQVLDEDEFDFTHEAPEPETEQRGATRIIEEEAPQGFLAGLLARFRKSPEDDEDDYEDEDEDEDMDLHQDSQLEDDDLSELDDYDDEDDDLPALENDYEADEDDDADDAEELASSVMDEVDDALELIDADDIDQVNAFDESAAEAESMDDELEFDLSDELDEPQSIDFKVAPAISNEIESGFDTEDTETFEFALSNEPETNDDSDAADEAEATVAAIETLNFNLDTSTKTASTPTATQEPDAIEQLDFPSAKVETAGTNTDDGLGLNLGNLTFDENDIQMEDEEEFEYQPRTNMDECDTKLDLAVAYEAMGDVEGALEILDEVVSEGKPAQIEEANRLKAKWQES